MVKVKINQGTLIGTRNKTNANFEYDAFLDIPYAKPPIGDLRFKPPQSPTPWEGERDATTTSFDHASFQSTPEFIKGIASSTIGSEDCLYLNVYTPSPEAKGLPVMVYIHGGGFLMGSGTVSLFGDGKQDYFLEKNVVAVTINYRLGVFGFFSVDMPEAAGNMGLKDQVQALKWVQENISHFGGDKNNVTIYGISAGSASCDYLLLSPTSEGLFHKAILQSGSTLNHWAFSHDMYNKSLALARELGYQGPAEDAKAIYIHVINMPTEVIGKAFTEISRKSASKRVGSEFVPSIEKDFGNGDAFITEHPYKMLKDGNFKKVPVIRGFCNAEGLLMVLTKNKEFTEFVMNKNFIDFFAVKTDMKYNMKFKELYAEKNGNDDFAVDFFTDIDFAAGILISALMTSQNGQPTYLYEFSYDGSLNTLKILFGSDRKGGSHGDDMGYIFPMKQEGNEVDKKVSKIMVQMWTDFAKTKNPTPSTSDLIPIKWPQFDTNGRQYLEINENLHVKTNYYPERVAIFQEILEEQYRTMKKNKQ